MNLLTRSLSGIFLALTLAACGSTTTFNVRTGAVYAPQRGPVRVFLEADSVPPGFEEVALVQAVGRGTHANLAHAIEGLREEAQALGCNALVKVRIDQGAATTSALGIAGRTPQ